MTRIPHNDLHQEAMSLLEEARARSLTLRALGGLAVRLMCPCAAHPPLDRRYKDIDLVGLSSEREAIELLLDEFGYEPDVGFNLLSGHSRLYYRDHAHGRQLDVFLDGMNMCHALDLRDRLELHDLTITPTDLLLSKLQVVETNERDLKDAAAVLAECEIEVSYVARLLARDWGWWRTVTDVLDKLSTHIASLDFPQRAEVQHKIEKMRAAIDAEPKGLRWKLRARIGDRLRWYEVPEEDHAAASPETSTAV